MDLPRRLPFQLTIATFALAASIAAQDDFPVVPEDIEVSLFASDPLVRNPCAITFDAAGRLCVGMGPQYRSPKPDTPGDSVWVLTDADADGKADSRHEFATGFNSIQGLAWRGSELFVANAPDLTVVSDTDGDGTADRYVRLYTDLGNLEHGLHGLNFGPDGKLYMSKGNSKGLTQLPDRLAPQPFRELWGVKTPEGTPSFPPPVTSDAASYQNNYHDPRDDWGITGGVLRCNPDGSDLEIVSRGFRNPWDITFDATFDWLGTDNDQNLGDKIFAPFFGANFGWGHPWSYDWKGDDHLPSAPSSGPLFEGSGTGIIFCGLPSYPDKYRDVFFINDWLRREVYIYRPTWNGARRHTKSARFDILAHAGGGRAMPKSDGRSFDPVDIELGPDGAIWISSWGRQYGAHYEDGQLANAGRIYRLWPKSAPPSKAGRPGPINALGSHLPVWRTNAQEELLGRGGSIAPALNRILDDPSTPPALETWAIWTLGRIAPENTWRTNTLNQHLQSIRIQALAESPNPAVRTALTDPEPRIRHEAILTTRQTNQSAWAADIVHLLATEQDRIVYYAAWGALVDLLPVPALNDLLTDKRPAVRRAALLALLEQDALTEPEITPLAKDPDPLNAALATKRIGGKARVETKGRPLNATLPPPPPPAVRPFENITASSGRPYRTATLAPGTPVYTDRSYKIRNVPAELANAPFLQTANSDADASSGITVTLDLKYPSTLYLADDDRAEAPPAWVRKEWQPTDLTIETDDPKRMRLYRREAPAGKISLGTNRDGVHSRKGNYILVAVPKLLVPTDKAATLEASLAALPDADPSRGRDLFLSTRGANCAACHQLEGIGNNHAPDLSDIGNRTDAEFLITSIIDPSAAITEGFAAQMVTTTSGAAFTGILLGETGKHLTIAMTGGAKTDIARADITRQETLEISAMPPGFDVMLSSLQVADITAYLLTLKKPTPPDTGAHFTFRPTKNELHLHLGDTRIATYLTDHPNLTRRAFANVHSPSGIPVTRPFPAPADEDHATMHPGLWIAFGWIDGNDYWRLQSKVRFDKYLNLPTADATTASFSTRNHYLDKPGTSTVCTEDTHYRFERTAHGIAIHIDATFYNDERDFAFGDQEESGLALRMANPLNVKHGNGRILNDTGGRDGKGTWGKPFRWIDYSGIVGDTRVGLLVVPHPNNPRPSWSHSRDYGALVANPFPKQPDERREPYVTTTVKKGERFRLRYTVHLHESPAATFDPTSILE